MCGQGEPPAERVGADGEVGGMVSIDTLAYFGVLWALVLVVLPVAHWLVRAAAWVWGRVTG